MIRPDLIEEELSLISTNSKYFEEKILFVSSKQSGYEENYSVLD